MLDPNAEFARKASRQAPQADAVREQVVTWLATRELDDAVRMQIDMLWTSASEP